MQQPRAPYLMASIVPQVTEHLFQDHLDWFRKWTGLLDMEFTDSSREPDRGVRPPQV